MREINMEIMCVLTNGFEDIEAIGTIALLRRANITIDVYALHNNDALGRFNVHYADLLNLKTLNLEDYGCLFIAGGPQYVELENSKDFINIVKHFYEKKKYIAAICAGPTILGHLGYLKGLKYTCFTSMNEDFGGEYIDTYCVKDKNIITGRSASAVIDFAFLLIKTIAGEEVENKIKKQIYYDKK